MEEEFCDGRTHAVCDQTQIPRSVQKLGMLPRCSETGLYSSQLRKYPERCLSITRKEETTPEGDAWQVDEPYGNEDSRGAAIVVQHPTQSLALLDRSKALGEAGLRNDQLVAERLVAPDDNVPQTLGLPSAASPSRTVSIGPGTTL